MVRIRPARHLSAGRAVCFCGSNLRQLIGFCPRARRILWTASVFLPPKIWQKGRFSLFLASQTESAFRPGFRTSVSGGRRAADAPGSGVRAFRSNPNCHLKIVFAYERKSLVAGVAACGGMCRGVDRLQGRRERRGAEWARDPLRGVRSRCGCGRRCADAGLRNCGRRRARNAGGAGRRDGRLGALVRYLRGGGAAFRGGCQRYGGRAHGRGLCDLARSRAARARFSCRSIRATRPSATSGTSTMRRLRWTTSRPSSRSRSGPIPRTAIMPTSSSTDSRTSRRSARTATCSWGWIPTRRTGPQPLRWT